MVASNSEENTAELLFVALDSGDMERANEIMDRHPESVDARDEEKRVPLHYAADCADLETFQRILNSNRSLMDAQDQFGFTPLLVSVMAGNLEVMEFLIQQGAQLGHLDNDGHSAAHWAVVCGQLEILTALQRFGAPFELADVHGAFPLHYATVSSSAFAEEKVPEERAEAILHTLLRHGVHLECADVDGRTPLLWAASDGNLWAFCALIQAGANRFAVDRDALGVVHCAASHGHAHILREMTSLLVGQSAAIAVDAKDRNLDTPLFYAATFGHWECAKILLEKGANSNHTDKRMRTAAHCAAAKGQLRVLKLLRQFGASWNLQNYRGDLPFHEAVQTGIKEVVEWFLDIDPNFISAPNFCGRSPLHLAASKGSKELAHLLCSRGALINALMMHKGQLLTSLDVAKRRGHQMVSEYLVGCGALGADDLPAEEKILQRKSIEEQMEMVNSLKTNVELARNDEMGRDEMLSLLRRGHSFWMPQKGSAGREMVDAGTMMSRRSSSASGSLYFKKKVPRATSTTDLAKMATTNTQKMANQRQGVEQRSEGEQDNVGKAEMEKTIQRIVKEELQKAKEIVKGERQRGTEKEHADSARNEESDRREGETEEGEEEEERSECQKHFVPKQHNTTAAEFRAKHSARERAPQTDGPRNEQTNGHNDSGKVRTKMGAKIGEWGTERRRIGRRMTPRGAERTAEGAEDAEVTELHILEEGLSPPVPSHNHQPIGRMAEFECQASHFPVARRYIHEKAIFDELTHLKRMQLQYRCVNEDVLVRSLVQNFCRMHSIHPSHFRRVHTFHHWEKFLYDQLKLIYLEERDRISAAAAAASQRAAAAAGAAGTHPMALHSAQQRAFAVSAAAGGAAATGAPIQRRFDVRILPRTDPLEERMNELSRIYGSGSSSKNSVVQMLEDEHQRKGARNGKENGKRKKVAREKDDGRGHQRTEETGEEEGESHL